MEIVEIYRKLKKHHSVPGLGTMLEDVVLDNDMIDCNYQHHQSLDNRECF